MTLALRGFADFPAYVASLRPRLRTQVRAYARSFAAAGGKIEVCESPSEADLDAFARLYASTCDRHARLGEIEVPIPLDRAFFERIFRMPEGRRRAFVARLGGEAIAFALTVDSGRSLYFTHCGLDYGRAAPTRAYFNLYYAMIEYAIARGYEEVELGAQAYEVKRKLGGVAHATRYHFEVARPVLGAVARLVAGNFSSQEGSAVSSKATS
jgi:predicted N-acyltransferase